MIKPNYVLVIDAKKKPLTPCKPSRAKKLLNAGKAAIYRRFPFTIILKKRCSAVLDGAFKQRGRGRNLVPPLENRIQQREGLAIFSVN